jgi:hypothetical protein
LDLEEAETTINITYSECVSVALVIQYAMFVHHIAIWELSGSTIFYGAILGENY